MEAGGPAKDIIDLGMGNPDIGTPIILSTNWLKPPGNQHNHRYSASMGITRS
jgi:alanine-synthesizing transaminase